MHSIADWCFKILRIGWQRLREAHKNDNAPSSINPELFQISRLFLTRFEISWLCRFRATRIFCQPIWKTSSVSILWCHNPPWGQKRMQVKPLTNPKKFAILQTTSNLIIGKLESFFFRFVGVDILIRIIMCPSLMPHFDFRWGIWVAKNPALVIVSSLLVAALSSVGFLNFS